ncbi:MAG: hypothetical protein MUF19_01965 [Candidatus Pacebacteria bacterium]|jgi:hypothetical protein|nr:hypothetical protein [Candidatus Paceibacterota bacterium]
MTKRALESYRIFPYIAWTLVIGFALFVYQITVETTRAAADLSERTNHLEQLVNGQVSSTTKP